MVSVLARIRTHGLRLTREVKGVNKTTEPTSRYVHFYAFPDRPDFGFTMRHDIRDVIHIMIRTILTCIYCVRTVPREPIRRLDTITISHQIANSTVAPTERRIGFLTRRIIIKLPARGTSLLMGLLSPLAAYHTAVHTHTIVDRGCTEGRKEGTFIYLYICQEEDPDP